MKLKKTTLYIVLYILLVILHFGVWKLWVNDFAELFFKYYLFLSFIFIFVIGNLIIFKKVFPGYTGFVFMGLLLFKLMIMFLIMQKFQLSIVPYYKIHFVLPYLLSLLLETLFAIQLIKDEKNQ
ncbi:hypothetical protein HNQ03_001640 [Chryseobacterium sp. 16F]|uniref:Uncharacterized protein n=1 Tax=Frigoriflavimonas asaccharolytica TaxID=2735899 RepID=A0A8J8G6U0_9FLAO|nr:hypothetical protein [Frigoriflavimonas asaccharolytica]